MYILCPSPENEASVYARRASLSLVRATLALLSHDLGRSRFPVSSCASELYHSLSHYSRCMVLLPQHRLAVVLSHQVFLLKTDDRR